MAGADKRAKLLSDLVAAKGGAAAEAATPAEPERAAVIPIAKRRSSEDRAGEAAATPGVLYSKGAATASTFRPSYWSFDREQQAEPKPAPARADPAPPPAPAAPIARAPTSTPLPISFVIAFGCVALFVSTTLFVLSRQHRAEAPAIAETPAIAAAPAPAPAAQVLPVPPAPSTGSAAAVTALPAQSAPPLATAGPAAKAPAPTEPAPVVASTPAPSPAPSTDAQQVDALLARGDALLATGDVAAARLFYQRAAELGSAAAATAVGQTYDPAILELLRVRGARGDARMAAEWYRKAIAAGDRQAEIRLNRLLAR